MVAGFFLNKELKMKSLIFALSLLPTLAVADVSGMAMRISCATFVDLTNGDVENTISVRAYLQGLIEGVAIANGIDVPGEMPGATRAIIKACAENPTQSLDSALREHITVEMFRKMFP